MLYCIPRLSKNTAEGVLEMVSFWGRQPEVEFSCPDVPFYSFSVDLKGKQPGRTDLDLVKF